MVDRTTSFDEVFVAEFTSVERTVFLIVHDREVAKEVTQDAFVALLRAWWKVSRYERPGAWVRRVAIRLAVRAVRKHESRSRAEIRAWDPPGPAPSRDLGHGQASSRPVSASRRPAAHGQVIRAQPASRMLSEART